MGFISTNDFNRIAYFYDALATVFFGKSLRKAQLHFLQEIPRATTVLILGGGTGWIAEELLRINPDAQIVYVEPSTKMMEQATARLKGKEVTFICGNENQIPPGPFQVVITPFFLDLFPDFRLKEIIRIIKSKMEIKSIWIATDFVSEKWWHKMYLWCMYRFFKITCAIEADELPQWVLAMRRSGFAVAREERFFAGFISTVVMSKGDLLRVKIEGE